MNADCEPSGSTSAAAPHAHDLDIPVEMKALDETLARLEAVIYDLTSRLDPVLHDESSDKLTAGRMHESHTRSPLASQINGCVEHVLAQCARLDRLLDMIQL